MAFELRLEEPSDAAAIAEVTRAAFEGHPHSDQTEHRIVDRLRERGGLALSLVAAEKGRIVGHVAFSPVRIGLDSPGWFALAPLSVGPGHQRQGIGSALVRAGLTRLQAAGARGCVVLGEPDFYGRFGFRLYPEITLTGVPREYFQAIVLSGEPPEGEATFHPAFAVD